MRRAKESGKSIGRPQALIDKNRLIKLLADNKPRSRIAKDLGISKATLYNELRHM
jgi:putative DNA-invertase from lambdoid prophage Rac